jgi:hypothetical protein
MAIRLQLRRDTSANWAANNPILQMGEFGFDTTVNRFKIGIASNETSRWSALSYLNVIPSELAELAQDAVELAITAGTGISKTYNDIANTITLGVDTTIASKVYVDNAVDGLGNTLPETYIPLSLLGNADGVAELDATGYVPQTQLTNTITEVKGYTDTAISGLVNSAPATLNTLKELSDALGADANFATTTATALGTKITASSTETLTNKSISLGSNTFTGTKAQFNTAMSDADFVTLAGTEELTNKTLNSPILNSPTGLLKADVGLSLVDNTSDASKPVSTATQTELDTKLNKLVQTNAQAAAYQLAVGDAFKLIEMSGGGALTIVDSGLFPVGYTVDVLQTGSSQVTIQGSGFTPNATPGLKLRTQWSSATLIKRALNSWVVLGDLTV